MARQTQAYSRYDMLVAAPVEPGCSGAQSLFARCLTQAHQMYDRWRQRHELLTLDERELADIGLSKSDVLIEADKPFWR
jgi:uncharacterized protein YjiS (DUF1127 family)